MIFLKVFVPICLGALFWTFAEYVLHRFLGHVKTKFLVRTRFHKEHTKHHLKREYFTGAGDKFLTSIATTPLVFFLCNWASSTLFAVCFSASFILMYLSYELIHLRMHTKALPHPYASRMRAHHFYHHFVDEKMNHGVTTPLWDLVFGTFRKPATIHLRENFRMVWVKADEKGKYQDRWGQDYQVIPSA